MVLAGEHECARDLPAVDLQRDLVDVLLDDREQVAEQLALEVGQLGGRQQRRRVRLPGTVDRAMRGDAYAGVAQATARAGVVRYVRPSWSRCW
jgi:hypothetical protein